MLRVFFGCASNRYKGPVSCISYVETSEETDLVNLTEDAQKTILSMLNKGQWINDITNCCCDFKFTTTNATIWYHSQCGIFNDITHHRSMHLSDVDKGIINTLLGVSISIEMTIAETLPSCAAFEYKDGKPYCFYAYDDDGNLCRVFWNNFDGLNEKDRIIVDYYRNTIVFLNDNGYPSGWTPQFEVTAINVVSEEARNNTTPTN